MKKKKGFTLLELVITLALTLIVLGLISTFFISTAKTFKKAEISSDLQSEAQEIGNLLLTVGLQSEGLKDIKAYEKNSGELKDFNISLEEKRYYRDMLNDEGKINVTKVNFKLLNNYYSLELSDKVLKARKYDNLGQELIGDGYPKSLSENIEEFTIRPIDFRMNPDGSLYEMTAIEINMFLKDVRGRIEGEVPISTIIKFRNK